MRVALYCTLQPLGRSDVSKWESWDEDEGEDEGEWTMEWNEGTGKRRGERKRGGEEKRGGRRSSANNALHT